MTIAKIHDIIMADRQVMEYYIATELNIHAVIQNTLHMSKVSACCVPKLLGPDLKHSVQHVKEKCCHFLGKSERFSSEIYDSG